MLLRLSLLNFLWRISETSDYDKYWRSMKKLQLELFKDYDSTLNPYSTRFSNYTWNSGNTVNVTLIRSRLRSVQEPEQSFSAATLVLLEWTDPRLTWDSDDYGGIEHLYMRRSRVWMPEVVPCESTGVEAVALFDTLNVKISFYGHVAMLVYFFATHSCEIKADDFPFDRNHCMMCFMIMGSYIQEIELRGRMGEAPDILTTGEFDYYLYKERPVFMMNSVDDKLAFSTVFYHFVIARQPQFWVSLIILPTFFIGMLVLIGIFFGEDSGSLNGVVELGLTGMMSMTVIVGILNDSIAKSSSLSALGRFVYYDIIIVVVAIIVILFAIKLKRKLKKLSDRKLKCAKSNAFWLFVDQFGPSACTTRYILFTIFLALHVINLILMLIRPEDTGTFETLTSFNTTESVLPVS